MTASPELLVSDTTEAAAQRAAETVAAIIATCAGQRGAASFAMCGGTTPG
ncbi:hypothetical protein LCGC14_2852190, partial [marine sediment metagenome]